MKIDRFMVVYGAIIVACFIVFGRMRTLPAGQGMGIGKLNGVLSSDK